MLLDAKDVEYTELNGAVRKCGGECHINNCLGQHFIGAGLTGTQITIGSIPGNALGAHRNSGEIIAQATDSKKIVHNFPCTGMHSGKRFLRGSCENIIFPGQVTARAAESADLEGIREYAAEFCQEFGGEIKEIMDSPFTVVTPDSKNPDKQMYVAN